MLTSNNPIAKQSQEWILNSLLELIYKKNYQKITVTEICKHAELDRRTFYRNFDSKDDVMDFYFQLLRDEYVAMIANLESHSLFSITKIYFEFWKKHIQLIEVLYRDGLMMWILSKYDELLPIIHQLFYQDANENLNYLLAFNTGGFWNVLVKWISDGAKKTPEEMAFIVTEMVLKD